MKEPNFVIDEKGEMPILASRPMQVGTATFFNWQIEWRRGAFAYAPEINTLYYK